MEVGDSAETIVYRGARRSYVDCGHVNVRQERAFKFRNTFVPASRPAKFDGVTQHSIGAEYGFYAELKRK